MERKNIILDFIDPENRILYGSYKNFSPEEHIKLLTESLNLAVFICKDYCILPPCAVMQCKYARKTLMKAPDFFFNGLIKFPVRENSLATFFEKKDVIICHICMTMIIWDFLKKMDQVSF